MARPKTFSGRSKASRFALYNHKGGVGKTTLTVNIGHALAELGRKVLLVDSDPQCNLTAYLIEGNVVDDLLDHSDSPDGKTIWSAVKPVAEGTGEVRKIEALERRKNIYVLPGDIRLSELENELTDSWTQCLERKLKGFRGVAALSEVVNQVCIDQRIDFVFYDVGPNIGPLNRVILLDCDYFVIPAACDLFSVRALKTLGHSLSSWISGWRTISTLAPDGVPLLKGMPVFLGYIPQRFRTYGGTIASGFARFASRLDRQVVADVVTVLRRIDKELVLPQASSIRLGQVKEFSSAVSAAQLKGLPLWELDTIPQYQRDEAKTAFFEIAQKILQRMRG